MPTPSFEKSGLADDVLVPLLIATFSWWLHLIGRDREAKIREDSQQQQANLLRELQEAQQQHEENLQSRTETLAVKLQEKEQELELALKRQYEKFRSRLEERRQGWQLRLLKRRDSMAARLSIADHIGDVNGHLSAIDRILSAVPTEEVMKTGHRRDATADESIDESALVGAEPVIRIPKSLRHLISMPEDDGGR